MYIWCVYKHAYMGHMYTFFHGAYIYMYTWAYIYMYTWGVYIHVYMYTWVLHVYRFIFVATVVGQGSLVAAKIIAMLN